MIKIIWENLMNILGKVINYISEKLVKTKDWLERNVTHEQLEYDDLAPIDELENGEEYIKALDWALKNDKVTNIALTGPYGSGKSSIIRAYLKKHPSVKAITLSLATFSEKIRDGKGTDIIKLVDGNQDIEEGILKQLFYSVNQNKIPHSRYRKLYNIDMKKIYVFILFLVTGVFAGVCFFIPGTWSTSINWIINRSGSLNLNYKLIFSILLMVLLLCVYFITYFIWRFASKTKVKEVSIAEKVHLSEGNDAEDGSIFNKNMDEIVYFFEVTNFNVVFIEDLDRFENSEIFIKLRELNILLNNYEMIKRRIVFVYAIKDDLFFDKDRTKFFDFIIPVVPVINSTNSEELFSKLLRSKTNKLDITAAYITSVSPFIDDMRVLLNTINEFLLYKGILQNAQGLKLEDQKILSLVIFKNLYPKDFAELQLEKGIIKDAFLDKAKFVEKEKEKLKLVIEEKIKILGEIEYDSLKDISELKAAMLYKITGTNGFTRCITTKTGRKYYNDEIMSDDFELSDISSPYLDVEYFNGIRNNYSNTTRRRYENSDELQKYIARWEVLRNNIPERKAGLKAHVAKLQKTMRTLEEKTIKDLLELYTCDVIFSEEVRNNKLLIFMLRNGYIDENYDTYINYFHADSITTDDKNFILNVRNHTKQDYSYKLIKVKQVSEKLLVQEFGQREIYNYDLLEYLIKEIPESDKTNRFVKQLSDESDESWQFIDVFVDKTNVRDIFIMKLGKTWGGMWNYIYNHITLSDERKEYYFKLLVKNLNISDLKIQNNKGNIKKYLIETKDILGKLANEIADEKVIELVKALSVEFEDIETEGVSNKVINEIIKMKAYAININMLRAFVKRFSPNSLEAFEKANYTTLLKIKNEYILSYIYEQFKIYVVSVVLRIPTNTSENIDSVIDIIERLASEYQVGNEAVYYELIQKENTILPHFKDCCYERIEENKEQVQYIWDQFIYHNKVEFNWENLVFYWEKFGLTEMMEKCLSEQMNLLDKDNVDIPEEFVKDILISNITINAFRKFVSKHKVLNFDLSLNSFMKEKMDILINCRYFTITEDNIKQMKEYFPELWVKCIYKNKELFFEDIQSYKLATEDIKTLLLEGSFSEEEKILLLLEIGNDMDQGIAKIIYKMRIIVPKNIIERSWNYFTNEEKINIIIKYIKEFSVNELAKKLKDIGGIYAKLGENNTRHNEKLPMTEINYQLAVKLESKGYLSSIQKEEKGEAKEQVIICRVRKQD